MTIQHRGSFFRGMCLCLPFFASAGLRAAEPFRAVRIDQSLHLDGRLDDEAWKLAVPFGAFLQASPKPGSAPSERTEARILYDGLNLYVGIACFDSEPSKISASTMAHDAEDMDASDDNVIILLDPFQDKRTAYVFMVNPLGARTEGLAFGESPSFDWDGIWDAKARILKDGWSAEIRIPFKTISFNPGLTAWGINIQRYIARKQETIRAAGADLDSHFYNPNEAAVLEGIAGVRQGIGVTIRPYGLASLDHGPAANPAAPVRSPWDGTGGIDVYKNFTPNLVGAFSYNTDFAETEVDERQVNLTRFPLFYPEKRTFFLEGSEYFNFGTSSGGGEYHASFLPFFSRRLGLYEGEQVPILFGTKLYGRMGRTNVAVIDVQTRRFTDQAGGAYAGQNFVAARVSQNLWEESRVGMIFTYGNPMSPETNALAGVDFRYATSRFRGDKNLGFDAWGVYNWHKDPAPEVRTKHQAFGFRLDYPNDLWDMNASYGYYGDGLEPGLGFISRPGVQTLSLMAAYMPRPRKGGWVGKAVRQFFLDGWSGFYWDLAGRLETRSVSFEPGIRFESGDRIESEISVNYDVLPFDFEIADGVIIPQGPYSYTNARVGFETAVHRPYVLGFNRHFGRFYSGRYSETEVEVALKYKGFATVGAQANFIRGRLPEGDFDENIYELKADFFFSPNLGLMNYVQFDDVSNELGWQSRFRWQISPGNEIFFVFSKNWERVRDPRQRFLPMGDRSVLKLQLSIRP